jgi:hypothetical protein
MKNTLITLCAIALLTSCARFSTKQTDITADPTTGQPRRSIITKVSAYTFFSGTSELTKFKANQTDKGQTALVGALSQEGGQTNQLVDILKALAEVARAIPVK